MILKIKLIDTLIIIIAPALLPFKKKKKIAPTPSTTDGVQYNWKIEDPCYS